jgi:hypothetical protein
LLVKHNSPDAPTSRSISLVVASETSERAVRFRPEKWVEQLHLHGGAGIRLVVKDGGEAGREVANPDKRKLTEERRRRFKCAGAPEQVATTVAYQESVE